MTARRSDPLRPVFIVLAVGSAIGLVALILLLSPRKPTRRQWKGRLTVLRGAMAKVLLRERKSEDMRNAA